MKFLHTALEKKNLFNIFQQTHNQHKREMGKGVVFQEHHTQKTLSGEKNPFVYKKYMKKEKGKILLSDTHTHEIKVLYSQWFDHALRTPDLMYK